MPSKGLGLQGVIMPCSCHFVKFAPLQLLVITVVASFHLLGCKSGKSADAKISSEPIPSLSAIRSGADIDLNCVVDHLQNPPESFHYTFQVASDNSLSEDVEVTPQMIDGSFKNNYLPTATPLHGLPSELSRQYRWAIGRMASLFAIVHGTSALVNEGPEQVNGYAATKISVDTSRGTATEQRLYNSVLGSGGFEKGTVWVISPGCPVKISLDEELHAKDGSVTGKAHYEEAMVKK